MVVHLAAIGEKADKSGDSTMLSTKRITSGGVAATSSPSLSLPVVVPEPVVVPAGVVVASDPDPLPVSVLTSASTLHRSTWAEANSFACVCVCACNVQSCTTAARCASLMCAHALRKPLPPNAVAALQMRMTSMSGVTGGNVPGVGAMGRVDGTEVTSPVGFTPS